MKNLTKFEEKAIEFQKNSISVEEAIIRMEVSCNICSEKGLSCRGDCKKHCPVQQVHNFIIDIYTYLEKEKEKNKND